MRDLFPGLDDPALHQRAVAEAVVDGARERRVGLVAYQLPSGAIHCVDCDVYPQDSERVREGDPRVADQHCDLCNTPLREVTPLG
jgi:hypothetical protein